MEYLDAIFLSWKREIYLRILSIFNQCSILTELGDLIVRIKQRRTR